MKYNSGLRTKHLDAIIAKNPKRNRAEIEFVIFSIIKAIDIRVSSTQKYNLVIPNLGKIHTHGNVVSKRARNSAKRCSIYFKKVNDFSTEMLLF